MLKPQQKRYANGILIGSRIDCETAARHIREAGENRRELAAAWGKSWVSLQNLVVELRNQGFDCGEFLKEGPKPKVKETP